MTIDTSAIRKVLADFASDRYDIFNIESAAADKDYYVIFIDTLDDINEKLGISYSIPDVSEWISSIDADLNDDDITGSYAEISDHYRDQWVGQSMGIESTIREALDAIDAENEK